MPGRIRTIQRLIAAGAIWAVTTHGIWAEETEAFKTRWFSPDSPFNRPIVNPKITAYSETAISEFIAKSGKIGLDQDLWTTAVIYTDGKTVRRDDLRFSWPPVNFIWKSVPIPDALLEYGKWIETQSWGGRRLDGDARVCMYDASRRGFYSLWNTTINSTGTAISVRAGGFSPENGPGASIAGGAAAKTNYCLGLIRPEEMAAGKIEHALQMVWPVKLTLAANAPKSTVYPAIFSDGQGTDPTVHIPMGARLQLDPGLSDSQLRELGLKTTGDFTIAHALQVYGGFIVDTGPSDADIFLQLQFGRGREVYGELGEGTYGLARKRVLPKAILPHLRFVETPVTAALDPPRGPNNPQRDKP